MKALINANIFDFDSYTENQYILFQDKILETGPMSEFKGAEEDSHSSECSPYSECIDCNGCIVMPGLINCHTHIYSAFARGLNLPFNPKNFKDILDQLWWRLDNKLNKASVYYSGLTYGYECINNGVTTVIDHHASGMDIIGTLDSLKQSICEEVGIRGIFCFETSDRFDISKCIEENLTFALNNTEKYAGLFGMHASMSLSDNTLKVISESIKDLPIHIHVAESIDDEKDCIEKYGITIVERLAKYKLLKKHSVLAHCVYIDKKEAELIAKAKAYVAINPTSNMNNAVGMPDYKLLKEKKVDCIVGNDGLGTNITREYLNLVFGMKNRLNSPIAFSLEDLRETIGNGYKYASETLGIKLGQIKKDYKADMLIIPYNAPTKIDESNAFAHVFYGVFDNFHPREVFCDGNCLMKNYIIEAELKDIYSRAKKESDRLWERIIKGG